MFTIENLAKRERRLWNGLTHKRIRYSTITICLALLLCGCTPSDRVRTSDIDLAELSMKHQRLQYSYQEMQTRLEKLNNGIHSQEFLESKVVVRTATFAEGGETLEWILERGTLHCGSNGELPGFSFQSSEEDEPIGFDVDFCHAIAAAIFGKESASALKIIPLTSRRRLSVLQSGEIDVLIRNTTWTLSRDAAMDFEFGPIIFYGGQGMMVHTESGFAEINDLSNHTVCVELNTTTSQYLLKLFAQFGTEIEFQSFEKLDRLQEAYEDTICDGWVADRSALVGYRQQLNEPEKHKIFNEEISREPLAPVVRHGDSNWHDIIFWIVQCALNGEYLGVNQENVDRLLASSDSNIQKLLGIKGELGQTLGLSNDFCYQVLVQVGNYADIYERHFGEKTPQKLSRDANRLFNEGGLLYPIPFR